MLPDFWRIITGAACFMPSITERTSSAIAASKPSTGIDAMLPVGDGPPALLNRQSIRPCACMVCSMTRFQSASTVASAWMKRAFVPSLAARASPSALRRPVKTTLAPSAMNSSAVRAPIPLVAPVMMATLLSTMPIVVFSYDVVPSPSPRHDGERESKQLFERHDGGLHSLMAMPAPPRP